MPIAHKEGTETETIRHALVELRRLFQKKELVELWESAFGRRSKMDYADLRLLDAVRVCEAQSPTGETSVGDIARLLGIDPSRASRQVTGAVRRGLLRRAVAKDDGRKVILEVTAKGAALAAKGSELTRNRISLALEGWSEADRARFASDLDRFVQRLLR